ncbi:pro-sigmaK processing inhibitor BofA family protein [Paenibacillus marinisediminis]
MKTIMLVIFVVSLLSLLFMLFRRPNTARFITGFVVHGIVAFVLLYMVNTMGWIGDVRVPTNPATLVTVGVLGIPGLASIIFLKMVWF